MKMLKNLLRLYLFMRIIFFMEILDGKDHRGGAYEGFFEELIVELLNGRWKHWGVLGWPIPENATSGSELAIATGIFHAQLRSLVDQFIHTGIDNDGIEIPSNRRVRASVGEPPIPIFDVLYEWFVRNKPMPALNSDGTIAILTGRPQHNDRSQEQYARDMAIYYFEDLLASPLRGRISKCANPRCAQYFLRKRQRRTPIKRGNYCGECKLVGASERTRLSRSKKKREMLEIAAQALNASSTRLLPNNRSAWVAAQVNKKFGKIRFIHPKWVNQNRAAIEALAGKEGRGLLGGGLARL